MEYTKGELCACGNPQSHPIPHEHDRTEREKQIIEHYESLLKDMYEVNKKLLQFAKDFGAHRHLVDYPDNCSHCLLIKQGEQAQAKAEGGEGEK